MHERGDITPFPKIPRVAVKEPITRRNLNVGEDQPEEVIEELVSIINEYRDCVATNLFELGQATYIVTLRNSQVPVTSKPYRASNSEREEISRIIQEWREAELVRDTFFLRESRTVSSKEKRRVLLWIFGDLIDKPNECLSRYQPWTVI